MKRARIRTDLLDEEGRVLYPNGSSRWQRYSKKNNVFIFKEDYTLE